jgi:hypothetical protein
VGIIEGQKEINLTHEPIDLQRTTFFLSSACGIASWHFVRQEKLANIILGTQNCPHFPLHVWLIFHFTSCVKQKWVMYDKIMECSVMWWVSTMRRPDFGDIFKICGWFLSGVKGPLRTTGVQILVFSFRLPHRLPLGLTNGAHVEVYWFLKLNSVCCMTDNCQQLCHISFTYFLRARENQGVLLQTPCTIMLPSLSDYGK